MAKRLAEEQSVKFRVRQDREFESDFGEVGVNASIEAHPAAERA